MSSWRAPQPTKQTVPVSISPTSHIVSAKQVVSTSLASSAPHAIEPNEVLPITPPVAPLLLGDVALASPSAAQVILRVLVPSIPVLVLAYYNRTTSTELSYDGTRIEHCLTDTSDKARVVQNVNLLLKIRQRDWGPHQLPMIHLTSAGHQVDPPQRQQPPWLVAARQLVVLVAAPTVWLG